MKITLLRHNPTSLRHSADVENSLEATSKRGEKNSSSHAVLTFLFFVGKRSENLRNVAQSDKKWILCLRAKWPSSSTIKDFDHQHIRSSFLYVTSQLAKVKAFSLLWTCAVRRSTKEIFLLFTSSRESTRLMWDCQDDSEINDWNFRAIRKSFSLDVCISKGK